MSDPGTIILVTSPEWRNWQTHQLEGLAGAIPCRFKSCLRHLVFKGFAANNPANPFLFPSPLGENLGKILPSHCTHVASTPEATNGIPRTSQQHLPRCVH